MSEKFLNKKPNLNNKTILVTGGTGSFGNHIVKKIIKNYKPKKIIIFSRDELKQFDMSNELNAPKSYLRFFLGDVRDQDRVEDALKGVDIVFHAAALKHVESSEYNPYECIKTNIIGTQNIIRASLKNNVNKVIFISTDKATNPLNLYGATKLAAEKLIIAANNIKGKSRTIFSAVRYGNVIGSRGSLIPILDKCLKNNIKSVPITDPKMSRFFITLDQGVNFVLSNLNYMQGGEIFIPKIPSVKIIDIAKVYAPNKKIKIIGIRPGEKLHEVLISEDESIYAVETKDRYIILPRFYNFNKTKVKFKKIKKRFLYSSDLGSNLLNKKKLGIFIKNFI